MSHPKSSLFLSIIIILTISTATKANNLVESSSPYVLITEAQIIQQDSNVITFSEFPLDTNITNQYSNRGIIFGIDGNIPFITTDGANPTSPVLSGTPKFTGPIEGRFVNPNDGISPITVAAFSLDAGYFDTNGTTRIEWFDLNDNKLGGQTNSVIGIEHFNIYGGNIARWRIAIITSEPAGFVIDNLSIDFEPHELNKADDVNDSDCVVPGREINYTITYDYSGVGDTNVQIIDYLPVEIDYNSSLPSGDYNATERTVTWNIGTIPPDGNGAFALKVNVNNLAEPCGVLTNVCLIEGDISHKVVEVNTPVCCWNPGIIYVNDDANGRNTGMSWEDAYLDLQDALDRAALGSGTEIWVATGIYKPSIQDPCNPSGPFTFKLIDNIPVYGHFAGIETSLSQRNLNDPNNETILSGEDISVQCVVTASGLSQNNILDGFTTRDSAGVMIKNSYLVVSNCLLTGTNGIIALDSNCLVRNCIIKNCSHGIYANNSSFIVIDCNIHNNHSYGINAHFVDSGTPSSTRIENCIIRNNSIYGIAFYQYSQSSPPVVMKCKIYENLIHGIRVDSSSATILNNWIYNNGQLGVLLYYSIDPVTISNNAIFGNKQYGIYRSSGTTPVISSSIIYGNTPSDLSGCSATYSWLTANGDPCFVDADGNDFHLRPASLCIDAGDPCFMDFNETDIDGDSRIIDGDRDCVPRVDIGADELDWSWADFSKDKLVNFIDYAIFANSWLAIDPAKSFDGDNDVDIDDLILFCEEWLLYRPGPDLDRNSSVDFIDFGLLAESWQTDDASRSLDEDCDVDIYDLKIFCDHWLSEE